MALMLQGGDFIQAKLTDPAGRAAILAASTATDREAVEEKFLLTLSRRPTKVELQRVYDYLATDAKRPRRHKFEDVLHALVNHVEFLFQH